MNITLRLEGIPEEIIENMIKVGIASTKTEAIRAAILDYREHHPLEVSGMAEEKEIDARLQLSGWKGYLKDKKEDEVWNKYL